MTTLWSYEELKALLATFVLGVLLVVVVAKKSAKRKRDQRLAEPVDSTELRWKRLAMLDPQVCARFLLTNGCKPPF